MFCSTIIPTIGRPSLDQAVESVLSQSFGDEADFEIIVVNDSGRDLSDAYWQHSDRVTIIETVCHERSVARNVGAAIAKGKYLHFLDDDDWMAPNELNSFWKLASKCDAGLLYGVSQLLDRQHTPLLQLKHGLSGNVFLQTMAGEWIPLQASLIKSKIFFEVGGFDPLLAGPEDIDLLRRLTLQCDIAEIEELVAYVVLGESGSSTDFDSHHVGSRWAREKILESPGAYLRMRDTAGSSFWHGRLVRIYLTSAIWNLQHKKIGATISRGAHALHAMFIAGSRLFSTTFWRSLVKPYRSETFARGFKDESDLAARLQTQDPASGQGANQI